MRTRIAAIACVLGTLACLAGATPAGATVTSSHLTVASPTGSYFVYDESAPVPMSASGTSDGTTGDQVDINCYFGSTYVTLASGIGVAADGSFSFTGSYAGLEGLTCVLRAVPHGNTTDQPPGSPSNFTGPTLGVGAHRAYRYASGPNMGTPYNFYIAASQLMGSFDFFDVGDCAVTDSWVYDPGTFARGPTLDDCDAWLWWGNGFTSGSSPAATASELQVDGVSAYLPSHISFLGLTSNPGVPAVTYTYSIDPMTGNLVIDETDPVVKCSPDPTVYRPTASSCSSFVPAGIQFTVRMVQGHDGRVASVIQRISSTDGASHAVTLLEDNQFNHPGMDGEFNFPWTAGGLQPYTTVGQVIPGPASAPGSFFVKGSAALPDGSEAGQQGAVTFSNAPDNVKVLHGTNNNFSWIELAYQRTVPASGALALGFTYSNAFLAGETAADATAAEAAFRPGVAISSPPSGATTSQKQIAVSGTAGDANGLASVTVNGQSAAVAGDGTWTATVPLNPGANTITATATNVFGNTAQASTSATYNPPPTSTTTTAIIPPPLFVTLRFLLGGAPVPSPTGVSEKVTCQPFGGTCRGLAQLTTTEHLLGSKITALSAKKPKRRTKRVLVGSTSFSLAGGKTRTIFVPLNATGRKLLARFGRLPVTLKISLLNTRPPTVLTAKTTIKPKKKKRKKRKKR